MSSVDDGKVNTHVSGITKLMSKSTVATMKHGGSTVKSDASAFAGKIIVYSILGCPHCMKAKATLKELDLPFEDVRLDIFTHIRKAVSEKSGMTTVPQIYFNDVLVGGNDSLQALVADEEKLKEYIAKVKKNPMPADGPIIPDPSTAVGEEEDSLLLQCEQDECFSLVEKMIRADFVKTTRSGLFSSKNISVFSGKDFVKWITGDTEVDNAKAVEIGQTLLDRLFIKPNNPATKTFEDSSAQYNVVECEDGSALNTGPISPCVTKSGPELAETMRKIIVKLYALFLTSDGKKVDYKAMKASKEFDAYKRLSRELRRLEIASATREEKVAFFINVYNALVIHATVENGAPTGLWSRYKFFNNSKYIIGGYAYSLQDMENGVLRANRKGVGQLCVPFGDKDPRRKVALERVEPLIHFALVCGAKSCPAIKTYTTKDVYEELTFSAKAFMEEGVEVDESSKTVRLSAIFKWYQVDFGNSKKELVQFVIDHMSKGPKQETLKGFIEHGNFKVQFLKYDWSLNSK